MHKCIWSTSPQVFAWRLNTAIFAHKCVQKTQIPGAKNPNIGFFAREAVSNLQFEAASAFCSKFEIFTSLELLIKSVDILYKIQIIMYLINPYQHLTFLCQSDKIIFDKKYTERNE